MIDTVYCNKLSLSLLRIINPTVIAKQILVIEDEPNVMAFISQGLKESGYEVFMAYDGQNGLDLLNQKSIDLVVLDIVLPNMDGREIAGKIRDLGYNNLPIIMLTALGTTENIVKGLDAGADDYLVKPFKFKELLARIRVIDASNTVYIDHDILQLVKEFVNEGSKEPNITVKLIGFRKEYKIENSASHVTSMVC